MTGTGAADAVTAGRPLSARTANADPMVMSSFLIVIIPQVRRGIPRTFPAASARTAEESWVLRQVASAPGRRSTLLGVQLAVPVGDQRAQPGAGPGRCGTAPHPLIVCFRRVSWSRAERPGDDSPWSLPARPLQVHATGQWYVPLCPGLPHGTLVPGRVIPLPGLISKCSYLPR